MMRPNKRAVCNILMATFTYSPLFGAINSTVAAAQTVQNSTSTYQYDALGNLTKVIDPRQQTTTNVYDPLNRVGEILQPAPLAGSPRPKIVLKYDALDQLEKVTDPRSLVTDYTVDGLGNQTKLVSPDTGVATITHDDEGNIRTRTDARGKMTTYAYDAMNRLKSETYASGVASTFEYDGGPNGPIAAVGQLSKFTDESGSTVLLYDEMGRLSVKTQTHAALALTTKYSYWADGPGAGQVSSMTYPSVVS